MKLILKSAIRNLTRNPVVNSISLFGLSVSMALVIVISIYCYRELTTDRYHEKADQIYLFHYGEKLLFSEGVLKNQIELEIPAVKSVVRLRGGLEHDFYAGDKFVTANSISADLNFFNFFDYEPFEGSLSYSLANPHTVVLKKSLARKLFGNESAIGKVVNIDEKVDYTVSAVIEDVKANTCLKFDAVTPLSSHSGRDNKWLTEWGYRGFLTLLQLEENAQRNDVLFPIKKMIPDSAYSKEAELISLSDVYFMENVNYAGNILRFGDKRKLTLLLLAAGLVALIALFNFISITSSNWLNKIQQFGICKVIGAGQNHIFLHIFSDVFFTLFIAIILAIALVLSINPYIAGYTGINLDYQLLFSPAFILIVFLSVFLLCFLLTMLPLLQISKSNVINNLKNRLSPFEQKPSANHLLVVMQVLIAIVLLMFTILVKKQINFGCNNQAFDRKNIVGIELTSSLQEKKNLVVDVLDDYPAIDNYTFTTFKPGKHIRGFSINDVITTNIISADDTFFDLMGIKLIEGKFYNSDLKSELGKSVVNKTFLSEIKTGEPLDFWYRLADHKYTVDGVIEDFYYQSFHTPLEPLQIVNNGKASFCYFKMNTDNFTVMKNTLNDLQNDLEVLSPDKPVEIFFMDDAVEAMYAEEKQFYYTFSLFALCAVVICSLGIFALSLFTCWRKTKEIGIRKVNGAKVSEILAMLNKDFFKWVVIAFVIAIPIAYYAMNKWLENFAYKTSLSWWIFALAGLLALGIALLTVSWQSWKAATRNPVEALRYE